MTAEFSSLGDGAMLLEVEATYENGVLKLDEPLPLAEHERLVVRISPITSVAEESYGLIGWTGDPAILRRIADDDDCGVLESP
jgi:predicted DNA-binding antitoxin AbrB/MazE fold protein